ncbi:hypothetical protein BASA84_001684 [Batrachochytrium salamandrivorans]|nr:hypothetical protein BASA84_001737 [Batrachochytrium salamandrivorans]KAH9265411.1 hypothetical protein BASA84_001684 [Batrachochytrium salamandrivorans]
MEDLRSMFVGIDTEVIEAVFAANHNNVERTANALLEMSEQNPVGDAPMDNVSSVPVALSSTLQSVQSNALSGTTPQLQQPLCSISTSRAFKSDEQIAHELAQQMSDEEYSRQLQEEDHRAYAAQRHMQQDIQAAEESAPIGEMIIKTTHQIKETATKTFKSIFDKFHASFNPSNDSLNSSPYTSLPKHDDEFENFLEMGDDNEPLERAPARAHCMAETDLPNADVTPIISSHSAPK